MVNEKKELSLYGIIGEALHNAETEFYGTLEENEIDILDRKIYLKIEVCEVIDDLDGKKMIIVGKINSFPREIK